MKKMVLWCGNLVEKYSFRRVWGDSPVNFHTTKVCEQLIRYIMHYGILYIINHLVKKLGQLIDTVIGNIFLQKLSMIWRNGS